MRAWCVFDFLPRARLLPQSKLFDNFRSIPVKTDSHLTAENLIRLPICFSEEGCLRNFPNPVLVTD